MATSISINPISSDGYLNAVEAGQPLIITGTYTGSFNSSGDRIYLSIGPYDYSTLPNGGITASNGTWTLTVPANRVGTLTTGDVTAELYRNLGFGWYRDETRTASLTVDKVAPTITTTSPLLVAEGQTAVADLTATGNTGGFTLSGADASKFGIVNGKLVFLEAQDYEGSKQVFSVDVSARDAAGNVATKTLTINLTNVNEAPTAIALSSNTVAENTAGAVIGTVTTTDPDANETFTYTVSDNRFEVVNGQLKLKDGVSLNYEAASTINVTVTSKDAGNLSTQNAFTINVTNVNEAPTAVTLSANTVAENAAGAVIGTLTTTDPDAKDTIAYTVSDNRFEVVNGQLKLKADASLDYEAGSTVNVTVTATDAGGLFTQQQFAIDVTNVNEAPTAITLSTNTVAENAPGAVIGNLSAVDADANDSVTYTVNDTRFEVVNGQLKLKAGVPLDFEKEPVVNLEVTATDLGGLTKKQAFTINVGNVNDNAAIVDMNDSYDVAENQVVVATLSAADADNLGGFTYSVVGGADKDLFTVSNGQLVFKQAPDFEAGKTSFSVEVQVFDGVYKTTKTININLTDANDAPTAIALSASTVEENDEGAVIGTLSTTDQDANDTFTYSVNDTRFEVVDGQLKLKAGQGINYEIDPTVTVVVTSTDFAGASTQETFTITVTNVNDANPELTLAQTTFTLSEGQNDVDLVALTATDADSVTADLTFEITGGADAGKFEIQNGKLVYVGGALDYDLEGQQKSFQVKVKAFDNDRNESTEETITVNLRDVNDTAPEFTSGSTGTLSENQNNVVVATLASTDKDTTGEVTTYQVTGGADAGLFEINSNNELVYIGGALDYEYVNQKKSFAVTVTASDGVNTSSKEITVNLKDVNDNAPVIDMNPSYEAAENQLIVTTLIAKDQDTAEAGVKIFHVSGGADGALFSVDAEGRLVFNQAPDYEGGKTSFEVEVQLTDGHYIVKKTLTVVLTNVNDAPTAITLIGNTVDENAAGAVIGTLSTADQDAGETFTYAVDDARFEVVNGQLKLKTGQSLDFEAAGTVKVTVTSTDSKNASTTQDFTIEVQDKNDAPTAIALSAHVVNENAAGVVIGTLSTADQDANDTFTYTVSDDRFEVVGDQLKLKAGVSLDYEEVQAISLNVTSKDAGGLTKQHDFTVNVTNLNDNAPVITTVEVNLDENADGRTTPVFLADLEATDADGSINQLAFKDFTGPQFKVENGKLYYVGAPIDFEKAVQKEFSVQVEVTDGSYTTPKTITVKLQDVNDNAPLFEVDAAYDVNENQTFVLNLVQALNNQGMDPEDTYIFAVKGEDAGLFDIVNGKLVFRSAPDFETATKTAFNVEVEVSDGVYTVTKPVTINLKDVNEAPTAITLQKELGALTTAENGAAMKVASITVADDALGANTLSLVGEDAGMFEIRGNNELWFKGDADYEAQRSYSVAVKVTDAATGSVTSEVITVDVTDENDNAPVVDSYVYDLKENTTNVVVADLTSLDRDTVGINPAEFSIDGELEEFFMINENNQLVWIGPAVDFEAVDETAATLNVYAFDGVNRTTHTITINLTDVNEAPTAVNLGNRITQTAENSAAVQVAAITVIDDALGSETLSLVGEDAQYFEIRGSQLWFKGGANFEAKTSYSVAVKATDTAGAGSVTSETFTLNITDVNEAPSKIVIKSGGSVLENSANGTLVGSLSALDPDAGEAFTFSMLDSAGGRFSITADGQILVADSLKLDYEQATSHQVIVRATDKNGLIHDEAITLSIGDVLKEALNGSQGNDQIVGGAGNDWFFGGAGSDAIYGGAGRDTIDGGSGNDQIYGGAGKDTLKGGAGKDTFFFGDKETGSSKGQADYISDFNGKAGDRINLRAMDANTTKKGDQNFSWIGTNDFTKAGQARFEKANGFTYVYLNTDNDKAAEAVIKLKGMIDLQKSWFVL